MARGVLSNEDEVFIELIAVPGMPGIGCLKEDAFSGGDSVLQEFFAFDGFFVADKNHARTANGCVKRDLVDRAPIPDEVYRGIHMSARMDAKGYLRDSSDIAFILIEGTLNVKRRVAGPVHHSISHRHRNVNPVIQA
jgi:hypothetical protein